MNWAGWVILLLLPTMAVVAAFISEWPESDLRSGRVEAKLISSDGKRCRLTIKPFSIYKSTFEFNTNAVGAERFRVGYTVHWTTRRFGQRRFYWED
jgi:hypothetical protein